MRWLWTMVISSAKATEELVGWGVCGILVGARRAGEKRTCAHAMGG